MLLLKRAIYQFSLNFGPQHPSAHGVLRLIVILKGEQVLRADPHIGLLHRGTEKLLEYKTYMQGLPYFDRLDYVSMLTQEHVFILAIEKLLPINVSLEIQYIRVLLSELTRILNHLLGITTHALDMGAITPFLWGFEEREKIMEFYERLSGARMHANFFRVGGISQKIPLLFYRDVLTFITQFNHTIVEMDSFLSNNTIWKERLKNVGILTSNIATNLNLSGVLLRSTGLPWDIRVNEPYEVYSFLNFKIPVGTVGDCYDRYKIRLYEMKESCAIIQQCLNWLLTDKESDRIINNTNYKYMLSSKTQLKESMETLIHHFKISTENIRIPSNSTYVAIEAPKGEMGVYLVSNNTNMPYRCKIKSPGLSHLQALNTMAQGHFLADLVAIIGTQDIVFGEVDR